MARSTPTLLTQADYARHRKARGLPGGSREAVRKAVDRGHISLINEKIDPAVADIQWEQNTRARFSPQAATGAAPGATLAAAVPGDLVAQANADTPLPAGGPALLTPKKYAEYRELREKAEAEMAVMNAAKMAGEQVDRADVDRAFFEMFRELRDGLKSSARRIGAEVSSLNTAEACEAVADREFTVLLEALVASYREKAGAPPKAVG